MNKKQQAIINREIKSVVRTVRSGRFTVSELVNIVGHPLEFVKAAIAAGKIAIDDTGIAYDPTAIEVNLEPIDYHDPLGMLSLDAGLELKIRSSKDGKIICTGDWINCHRACLAINASGIYRARTRRNGGNGCWLLVIEDRSIYRLEEVA